MEIKFRFFKFRWIRKGKKIFSLPMSFSSEKKLKEYIEREKVDDCYLSLNLFSCDHLIKRNYCIDLDFVLPEKVIKAVNLMEKEGYKEKYILQSSRHSYQIFYENFTEEEIKKIDKFLIKNKLQDEFVQNIDDKLVIRLPETKHHSGFLGRYITIEDLKKMRKKTLPTKKAKKEIRFYYTAIMSGVLGTKNRHVLILKNCNYKKIREIQKTYRIGDLYKICFKRDNYIISLKTFSKKRLDKIFKAINKKPFKTVNFLRVSQKVIKEEGRISVLESGIRKIIEIKSPIKVKGQFSKGHFNLLRKYLEIEEPSNLIGKEKLKYFELEFVGKIK